MTIRMPQNATTSPITRSTTCVTVIATSVTPRQFTTSVLPGCTNNNPANTLTDGN